MFIGDFTIKTLTLTYQRAMIATVAAGQEPLAGNVRPPLSPFPAHCFAGAPRAPLHHFWPRTLRLKGVRRVPGSNVNEAPVL